MKEILTVLLFLVAYLGSGNQVALSQATFYQDKTITVILGGPPGGTADLRTRPLLLFSASIFPETRPSLWSTWKRGEAGRPPTTSTPGQRRMALRSAAWDLLS